jgi:hypothetical protein
VQSPSERLRIANAISGVLSATLTLVLLQACPSFGTNKRAALAYSDSVSWKGDFASTDMESANQSCQQVPSVWHLSPYLEMSQP